jgi:mono/diheme cytochrome c family protein
MKKFIAVKRISNLLGVLALSGAYCLAPAQEPAKQAQSDSQEYRALVNKYCVGCHSDKLKTAGLSLEKTDLGDPASRPDVWEKVVRKLRAGAMPRDASFRNAAARPRYRGSFRRLAREHS